MGTNQEQRGVAGTIGPCSDQDRPDILRIVNAAAEAYRGTIPVDRWHDPYMSEEELASEIADGVVLATSLNTLDCPSGPLVGRHSAMSTSVGPGSHGQPAT